MLKSRFVALIVVLTLLVSGLSVMAQDQTITDIVTTNENFSTLAAAVQAAGLADVLAGEGPFTVYAPTNDAFAKLPETTINYLLSDTELLTNVLNYHVVTDETAMISGANVIEDITASNGVIHAIDTVLIPEITLPEVDPLSVSGDVITAGSSTVFPLTERMAEVFTDEGYAGNVTIDSVGSGAGIERFCVTGETDIANSSRAISAEEIEQCTSIGRAPLEFRVGTDALSVVVSSTNDFVQDVTSEELAAIFSTAINWSDVRPEWPNEPIQRYIPGTDSGTFDYFVEAIFDKEEEPILSASNTQLSEDDNVLVQGVESSPYAVAFFGYAYYQENADALQALAIDSIAPTAETAESNEYPISRPLFIYSTSSIINEKPQVGAFINYYLTTVNDQILDVGYFPASSNALNTARLNLLAALNAGM